MNTNFQFMEESLRFYDRRHRDQEGVIERLQSEAEEREAENRGLREKCGNLERRIRELERDCVVPERPPPPAYVPPPPPPPPPPAMKVLSKLLPWRGGMFS